MFYLAILAILAVNLFNTEETKCRPILGLDEVFRRCCLWIEHDALTINGFHPYARIQHVGNSVTSKQSVRHLRDYSVETRSEALASERSVRWRLIGILY